MEEKNIFQTRITPALENSITSSCVKEVFQSCSFDVKKDDGKASLIPRDADKNTRGESQPLGSGGLVKTYVESICRINTGSRTHVSFSKKKALGKAKGKSA